MKHRKMQPNSRCVMHTANKAVASLKVDMYVLLQTGAPPPPPGAASQVQLLQLRLHQCVHHWLLLTAAMTPC